MKNIYINQRGSSYFFCLVILLIITLFIVSHIGKDLNFIKCERDHYQALLCTREINLNVTNLAKKIERSNRVLKLLKIGDWASILLPHMKIATKAAAKTAENLLKRKQILDIQLYRTRFFQMRKMNCSIPWKAYKSPYEAYLVRVKRNHFNQILKREEKWNLKHRQNSFKAQTDFYLEQGLSRTKIKKVRWF